MPIFEQTYRKWEGVLKTTGLRWLPIMTSGIRLTFKKRRFLVFYILCLSSVLVFGAMLAFRALLPSSVDLSSDYFQIGPTFFAHFLFIQSNFIFILAIWTGANLINDDYKTNALQQYLSKPITSLDYLMGKFSILAFFILSITAAPALLLFVMRVLMMPDKKWLLSYFWIIFAILGYSVFLAIVHSLFILFLSAVTNNSRFTGIAYFLIIFLSDGIANGMMEATRTNKMMLLSFSQDIWGAFPIFFGEYAYKIPGTEIKFPAPALSLLTLLFFSFIFFLIIRKKVSKIEVIQ